MENIYEQMWKNNKSWAEAGLVYCNSLMRSYHPEANPDYKKIENLHVAYQFILDKLNQDEKLNADKISEYHEWSRSDGISQQSR